MIHSHLQGGKTYNKVYTFKQKKYLHLFQQKHWSFQRYYSILFTLGIAKQLFCFVGCVYVLNNIQCKLIFFTYSTCWYDLYLLAFLSGNADSLSIYYSFNNIYDVFVLLLSFMLFMICCLLSFPLILLIICFAYFFYFSAYCYRRFCVYGIIIYDSHKHCLWLYVIIWIRSMNDKNTNV